MTNYNLDNLKEMGIDGTAFTMNVTNFYFATFLPMMRRKTFTEGDAQALELLKQMVEAIEAKAE